MNIEKSQEQSFPQEQNIQLDKNILEKTHEEVLLGESYEDATKAVNEIEALQNFREKLHNVPFSSFHEVIEEITNINKASLSEKDKQDSIENLVDIMRERVSKLSPRVADLYEGILAEIKREPFKAKFTGKPGDVDTEQALAELKEKGDLHVLFSPNTSWEMKLNRIETRLTGYLLGARAIDKRDGKEMDDDVRKWRKEEIDKMPKMPSEDADESEPGVDPLERKKEGEPVSAIWQIEKAYNGYCKYFREKAFSQWDTLHNKWIGKYQYSNAETASLSGNEDDKKGHIDLVKTARIPAGQRVRVPIPYTHKLNKIEAEGRAYKMEQNQDGDISIFVKGDGDLTVKIFLAAYPDKKFKSDPQSVKTPEMPSEFSEETENKIQEIKDKKTGNIKRAHALASYVRSRIKYLAPKDRTESEKYNSTYRTHPKGFAGAVDEIKEGDCDVVNTYFSALCARLDIPTRHVVGHSVDEDENGNLITHFGTGHAWSEVWDEIKKEWILIDATPPGDRNLEESEEDNKEQKKHQPGQFGEQEATRPTDEELEKLRKKLAEHKEKLSYTREERELSEHAGVELKEARQIVKEINKAEQTRLPNGERIVDVLSRLFNAIIESRKSMISAYTGPVRRREGGEAIEDIVRHKIGVLSGDTDPVSREKPTEELREEKNIGGFDLYNICDKSGSMTSTNEAGESLWEIQRRTKYLIFSSLNRFEKNLKRAGLQKDNTLSVQSQGISFRGSGEDEIDLDKQLSTEFTAKDKVKMWHSLTGAPGGNGDPEALSYVYEQIKKEVEETKKHGKKDDRLRFIMAFSDGGYIGNDASEMQVLSKKIYELEANTIVVGLGLTKTAASVPVVMENPPFSRGSVIEDINDLPAVEAKYVILEAIKLFPEKAKEDAKQIILNSLDKFKNIK